MLEVLEERLAKEAKENEELEMEEFGLPDTLHVTAMMQALEDTVERKVSGTEHLALTDFQDYAGVVLGMNGFKDVAGNESLFSSVGKGMQASWDYVKKMFNGIWSFFFGKKTDDVLKEAETEIGKAVVELKKAEGNSSNEGPTAEQTASLKQDIMAMVATKKAFLLKIKDFSADKIKETMDALPDAKTIGLAVAVNYEVLTKKTEDFIKKFGDLKDGWVDSAHKLSEEFLQNVSELKKLNKVFEANKSKMASLISSIEKKTKEAAVEGYDKAVGMLKRLMVNSALAANYIRTSTGQMINNTKKTLKAYGLAAVITVSNMSGPKTA